MTLPVMPAGDQHEGHVANKSGLSEGASIAVLPSSAASVGAESASAAALVVTEPLGASGRLLSAYHIGDLTGILGLVLTGMTFLQARAAKAAAKEAAATAIRSRDRVEVAARLADLSNRLRGIRDVYRSDDWSYLDVAKDQAVSLAVEVAATLKNDAEIVRLMTEIQASVRADDPLIEHMKDDAKRRSTQARCALRVNKLADAVDLAKLTKVKHES